VAATQVVREFRLELARNRDVARSDPDFFIQRERARIEVGGTDGRPDCIGSTERIYQHTHLHSGPGFCSEQIHETPLERSFRPHEGFQMDGVASRADILFERRIERPVLQHRHRVARIDRAARHAGQEHQQGVEHDGSLAGRRKPRFAHYNRPMHLGFEHSYSALPATFHARVEPTHVANPTLVIFNRNLATQLGLDPVEVAANAAAMFSGNALPDDAVPLAMAYAGHQFGQFVPRLGDGRAILLGEIRDRDGVLRDLQLKGAGRTPFSRGGDGRAALGPMLREYLISEAMHALCIPTTRSLAVVTTGETVLRDGSLAGAVLTRVAASHVRVGTFQYLAARQDDVAVRQLLDYVIARHYPAARAAPRPAVAVLQFVAERQAALVAQWMLTGFIHGVMNTDNMAISGETIDYGPCAFMDRYDPNTVFSSIDHQGRYAYANQPMIAQWNLARLAETLLPLIDADLDAAVELATSVVAGFMDSFDAHFLAGMRLKLGLATAADGDAGLVGGLLATLRAEGADFTLVFRRLCDVAESPAAEIRLRELFAGSPALDQWLRDWQLRLIREPATPAVRAAAMRRANPAFIPRNHRVEAALQAATTTGDFGPFHALCAILQRPYDEQPAAAEFMAPPEPTGEVYRTFCGT
jgi:serine/tyrosine/threonine adenylyltransferase